MPNIVVGRFTIVASFIAAIVVNIIVAVGVNTMTRISYNQATQDTLPLTCIAILMISFMGLCTIGVAKILLPTERSTTTEDIIRLILQLYETLQRDTNRSYGGVPPSCNVDLNQHIISAMV